MFGTLKTRGMKLRFKKEMQQAILTGPDLKEDLMKCKREEEDLLSTFIRKKASYMNLKKASNRVSARNQQLSENSHLFNLKTCLELPLKT